MKIKKTFTVKKLLFYILMFVIVGLFITTKLMGANKTVNSFKNTGYMGNALFYDTLKVLNYEVSYDLSPIESIQTEGLVVLNAATFVGQPTTQDYEMIADYVKEGGKMLVLFSQVPSIDEEAAFEGLERVSNVEGPFEQWTFGAEGVLMYGNIETMSNTFVSTERELTYSALKALHPYIVRDGVVFNEYYLYVSEGNRSLWKEMPQGLKFTLIQLLLVFLCFVGYKGKRFGAPLKLYEEVEPDEDQYAKAMGALYHQGGHWEVMLVAYYHHLLSRINRKYRLYMDVEEDSWVSAFETKKDKQLKAAQNVLHFMKGYQEGTLEKQSKRKMRKTIKEMLITIQYLEKSLDQ